MTDAKIYYDMCDEEYHASNALSQSKLSMILKNPHDYWAYHHAKIYDFKPTRDMKFGREFHSFLLTPNEFKKDYLVKEKIARRGVEWKRYIHEASKANKEIIFDTELEQMEEMQEAVTRQQKICGYTDLFNNAKTEVSIFWTDPEFEVPMKTRLDLLKDTNITIMDLKKTVSAKPDDFSWSVEKYFYNLQAAVNFEGVEQATGVKPTKFFCLCIENKEPYNCKMIQLSEMRIIEGHQLYRNALSDYVKYRDENFWPVYDADKIACV